MVTARSLPDSDPNRAEILVRSNHPRTQNTNPRQDDVFGYELQMLMSGVCVCVVIPFILDVRFADVPAGGHSGGWSYMISPPSFCGACLNFSREKDSAVPFPRRP